VSGADRPITYLTTLDLDDEWLDALVKACPNLDIRRQAATSADQISADVWAQTEILHTGNVLPDPALAPALRWIQLDTSGVEHVVGHPIWAEERVAITTLGGIAPVPMAEYVVMSLLQLAHHQPRLDALRRAKAWPSAADRLATLTPLPVDGATVTIVGYGRIGRECARLLHALGMKVVGVNRGGAARDAEVFDSGRAFADRDAVRVLAVSQLDSVLAETDYLVVLTPHTPETAGLIDASRIARLKRGACVVNASRGGVVHESALLEALASEQVRYASLDVFDDEPLPPESVWWEHRSAMITPHVAGLAPRYAEQVLSLLAANLIRYREDRPLLNRADRAAGY
jgi:phosphoglycerate dehydrogenase-like enzyme